MLLPSPAVLQRLGKLVRQHRQELHMSQAELAKGICTQTTISALENNGCFNKWTIVPVLLERLQIKLQELEKETNYHYGVRQLNQIELDLLTYRFHRAQRRLIQLKFENLEGTLLRARYWCALGFCQLFTDGSLDDATMNFSQVLQNQQKIIDQLLLGWSHFGMTVAYQRLGFSKQTHRSITQASRYLELSFTSLKTQQELFDSIRLSVSIVAFALQLQEPQLAQRECRLALQLLQQQYSDYGLSELYYLSGLSHRLLDQQQGAQTDLSRAAGLDFLPTAVNLKHLQRKLSKLCCES
ncbi:Transcriptional regulator, Cro, CI family [Fructilactobacillus florum 8D]|uniref:Transcriptional regulator, Cro, CI family n=2 Tax=Fructilactobacillus florum TaxID=640331 RepID=W9ECQ7_9LACO|nr:helix-turn-helix transcriptional regulator [Fructilactobacillus florum]EKK20884.1 Transcriptional regulator, Cro, CI family [Fructilactobacillus florum 2F]ETO39867.1 Transcriptional regulator, Cro, CI family [Fructilactobacillus florum 8D]KRM92447.1 hypothetical protein FC87_GL000059 [Fructilactobacillus florum DSM 22689 = JCM 16035]